MSTKGKIESKKMLVKEIFRNMWFNIPLYQRPYVWKSEHVSKLLEDLKFAMIENPENPKNPGNLDFEYFFGSFVFQSKAAGSETGQPYLVNDLLDGQQRMATLLMLFAVIRDLVSDVDTKRLCQSFIFQKEDRHLQIPEQTRIAYVTHPKVPEFIEKYIKTDTGTINENKLKDEMRKPNVSVKGMANAVLEMHKFFRDNPDTDPEKFLDFLLNNVLFISVSTEDWEDAFRLFRVLNDSGIQLQSSDLLKATNLAELKTSDERIKYAEMWEDAEDELGHDGFERFLNHVRTILVKDKARHELITEFEENIYPEKLQKGQETFDLIKRYLNIYRTLLDDKTTFHWYHSYEFGNLMKVMRNGLTGSDWMSPLLRYVERFEYIRILEFLKLLDIKYSADWIGRRSPTERIMAMVEIIKVIDAANNVEDVLGSDCFNIDKDKDSFIREIEDPVYGKNFARYLLLKLDYFYADHYEPMHVEKLSVEHILPQNPAKKSNWMNDFSEEQRAGWTHKIGNLVLMTGSKDAILGRLDYPEKVEKYFKDRITARQHALHVFHNYKKWTPEELKKNHDNVLAMVYENYGIVEGKGE